MKKHETNIFAQVEFIKDHLRQGKGYDFINRLFADRWPEMTQHQWGDRLRRANQQMLLEQQSITERANQLVELQAHQRATRILGVVERKEILTQIALGQLTVNKPINVGGKIEYVACEPDFTDRRNAIAELNKIDGSYQPFRADITTNGQSIAPVTTTIIQFNGVDIPLVQ